LQKVRAILPEKLTSNKKCTPELASKESSEEAGQNQSEPMVENNY